jgi:beta-lactam-binding protein with PASTA domain
MSTTPPQNDWPTQIQEPRTTVVESGGPAGEPVPPPVDPRRRPFEDFWPWLLGLALLAVAGLVALWWFQYHHKQHQASPPAATQPVTQPSVTATTPTKPAGKVGTPAVIGLKQSEAAAQLTQAGLKPLARPVKSLAAPGTVATQQPAPGTKLKRGSVVVLDVSAGKPAVVVPDVSGRLAPDAITALRKAGFQTAVVGVPSAQPKATVVAEAPAAGTRAPSGSKIRLNISKGTAQPAGTTPAGTTAAPSTPARTTPAASPATTSAATTTATTTTATTTSTPAPAPGVTVPDVTGTGMLPAVRTLEQAGLHTQVNLVQSSQPAGGVNSQDPSARSKADTGQVVQLNVSLGPNPAQLTQVADVTGQDAQQVTQTLQNAGFTVQTVDRKVIGVTQNGKVVDEQPSGQAPQGFTIILIVGRTG